MFDDSNHPERPRAEPEIIPPDRDGRRSDRRHSDGRNSPWRDDVFSRTRTSQRIYVGRVGPFGVVLLMLALAAIAAVILIAVLGAVLIWIPVVAVLVVGAALARALRR